MQYRNRTIELIAPVALAAMIDEYAIFGPKLGDRLPSFLGVSLSEHLVKIAFDEGVYGVRHGSLDTFMECGVLPPGSSQKLHFPGECDATSTTVLGQDPGGICKRRLARPVALPFAAQSEPRDRNGSCLHHSPNRHVMSFRRYAT